MIVMVPIEKQGGQRYSDQWYQWFCDGLKKAEKPFQVVGDMLNNYPVQTGQFLDVYETNIFKLDQMKQIVKLSKNFDHFTVFLLDLWCTGLEALFYVRDCASRDIKIAGVLHDGSYDKEDFLYHKGCEAWAADLERSWLRNVDIIFISSAYHMRIVQEERQVPSHKFRLVPWPVQTFPNEMRQRYKKPIILFPHRLTKEKAPEEFAEVQHLYTEKYGTTLDGEEVQWIRTRDFSLNKEEYYDLMSTSSVVFSSAYQEMFGIAMQEGVNLGLWPVAPNRLCYPETLNGFKLYNSLPEAVELIREGLLRGDLPVGRFSEDVSAFVREL